MADSMKTTPNVFYKYQPVTPMSLENLALSSVYFCSTVDLNDPFDCAIETKVKRPTNADINRLREFFAEGLSRDDPAVKQLFSTHRSEVREHATALLYKALENLRNQRLRTVGVTCFSESRNDVLMWSHYAERGRGFCLEFAANAEIFSKAKPIEYKPNLPLLDGVRLLLEPDSDDLLRLIRTKSEVWKYESEWRIFHEKPGTHFEYGQADLKAVYFGPRATTGTHHTVCTIARELHTSVKFYVGKLSSSGFSIEFDEKQFSTERKTERK